MGTIEVDCQNLVSVSWALIWLLVQLLFTWHLSLAAVDAHWPPHEIYLLGMCVRRTVEHLLPKRLQNCLLYKLLNRFLVCNNIITDICINQSARSLISH